MSTWWGTIDRLPKPQQDTVLRTIAALYDDTIDTEHTLNDLRKSDVAPEQISVILREHVLEGDHIVSSETQLSRVVAATAIDSVSTWLRGLATLVMSDRAAYLVAGPIGYILATVSSARTTRDRVGSETAAETDLVNQQLLRAVRRFGFSADESGYIEARIAAGSPFIAITAADVESLRTAHRIFSKRAAVYLGLARTDPQIESIAQHLAEMGPLPRSESVFVADTASNLVRADDLPTVPDELRDLRNRPVLTMDEAILGTVRDALYRRPRNGDAPQLRYLIVQRRRFRGLRAWLVAIPISAVEVGEQDIRLALSTDRLRHVPHYVMSRPMSRQEERELDIAFDLPPRPHRQHSGHDDGSDD
ncbi:MAG: PRC-barrel domain-containing protein [Thermomicrobiales bacterium]